MEKRNKFNLPKQFCEDYYNVIQTFQVKRNISLSIHIRELNTQGNEFYTTKGTFSYAIILFFHVRIVGGR